MGGFSLSGSLSFDWADVSVSNQERKLYRLDLFYRLLFLFTDVFLSGRFISSLDVVRTDRLIGEKGHVSICHYTCYLPLLEA